MRPRSRARTQADRSQETISGLAPESEPSAVRMQELQDVAEHDDVTTVFFGTWSATTRRRPSRMIRG
ncbi:hypothetical protein [Streptomyces synnematoformans]|uniref:hypothetical protein n=1 Tax=Streptomyces synnematoformans TaxID=415721 RepID=UPI0031DD2674